MNKVIGVDLGGTSISGGVFDRNGKLYKSYKEASLGHLGSKDLVLEKIRSVIDNLLDDDIIAIGLGSPGFVDVKEGKILDVGGNIRDWANTDVRGELKKFYDLPIIIDNDANVAAVCESWIGAGKNLDDFIMITLGTGLGGGIYFRDNGLWHGHHYEGAELGHTILYPNGRICNCGQKGCTERYVSGTGLELNYLEFTGKEITGEEIFERYEEDDYARKSVYKFIEDLGNFLITIKSIFDPQGIIIGGGVINSKDYWWDEVIEYYYENSNSSTKIEFLPAKHLNDSGMIGAAKRAFEYYDEIK